MPNNQIE